jgi:hypothetical protein
MWIVGWVWRDMVEGWRGDDECWKCWRVQDERWIGKIEEALFDLLDRGRDSYG